MLPFPCLRGPLQSLFTTGVIVKVDMPPSFLFHFSFRARIHHPFGQGVGLADLRNCAQTVSVKNLFCHILHYSYCTRPAHRKYGATQSKHLLSLFSCFAYVLSSGFQIETEMSRPLTGQREKVKSRLHIRLTGIKNFTFFQSDVCPTCNVWELIYTTYDHSMDGVSRDQVHNQPQHRSTICNRLRLLNSEHAWQNLLSSVPKNILIGYPPTDVSFDQKLPELELVVRWDVNLSLKPRKPLPVIF